ncbi:hypothetical protein MMC18_002237 [Xylographa bjoerkii]|nr:hypothetical protein [Xylographa bjoerkii]
MAKDNNNRSDNFNGNVRHSADGKINDYAAPPFPLAPWADSSYLTYGTTSHPPDPNPHGHVQARVVHYIDHEAAREAPSSSNRPAHSPAYVQRLQDHETRRLKRAAARRATSSLNVPTATELSPMEGLASEPAAPQATETAVLDWTTEAPSLSLALEQDPLESDLEEDSETYLDGMVGWMRTHVQQRNDAHAHSPSGFDNQRAPTLPFGLGLNVPAPTVPRFTDTTWPYTDRRLSQASMFDVNAILGTGPQVESDSERRRRNVAVQRASRKRLEERHRHG